MERVPNGRYTREFPEEAVKLVTAGGISVYDYRDSIANRIYR